MAAAIHCHKKPDKQITTIHNQALHAPQRMLTTTLSTWFTITNAQVAKNLCVDIHVFHTAGSVLVSPCCCHSWLFFLDPRVLSSTQLSIEQQMLIMTTVSPHCCSSLPQTPELAFFVLESKLTAKNVSYIFSVVVYL